MKKRQSLEGQIAALPDLDRSSLVEQYKRLHSHPAPMRWSRAHLEVAVAYRLQKQLNANLRNKMMQVLGATEAITSLLISNSQHSEIVREWRGRIYSVTLLDDGAVYNDRHYRSLSAVAQAITGKRGSGAAVFGLPEGTP